MKKCITVVASVATLVVLTLPTTSVAQQNYVLCRSLMDREVTNVFPDRCPSGWVFVKYV